jgi:hypothetical protein
MPEKQTLLPSTALPGYQLFEGSLKRLFFLEGGRTSMNSPLSGYHMFPSDTHPTLVKSPESSNFQRHLFTSSWMKNPGKKIHPLILNKATK